LIVISYVMAEHPKGALNSITRMEQDASITQVRKLDHQLNPHGETHI
jgi:hypothetical protein